MEQEIPAPGGQKKWYNRTIESILTNEKYKGSALFQKKFTVDFLAKKTKVNEGEVPQYFVEHSHPPIVDPEEFDMVQAYIRENATKSQKQDKYNERYNEYAQKSDEIKKAIALCRRKSHGDCHGRNCLMGWHVS